MTRHWLELVNQWLEVTRPFLWLHSTKSWLDSDSIRQNCRWLWLEGLVTLTRQKWLGHITDQWWRKLFVEVNVGASSGWYEGNRFKVGGPGSGNENFLAELYQSLVFLHIYLSEVHGPVPTRPPRSSLYGCYPTQLRNLVKISMVRKASSYEPWWRFKAERLSPQQWRSNGEAGGRRPLAAL